MEKRPFTAPPMTASNGCARIGILQLSWALRVLADTSRAIMNSPARDQRLCDTLNKADGLLVSVLPSVLDIRATTEFLEEICALPGFRIPERRASGVGNLGNRKNRYVHQINRFLCRIEAHS